MSNNPLPWQAPPDDFQPSTYLERQKIEADMMQHGAGRFRKEAAVQVTANPIYPRQRQPGPWNQPPNPVEPPWPHGGLGDTFGIALGGASPAKEET
jgi:hypothetical protein